MSKGVAGSTAAVTFAHVPESPYAIDPAPEVLARRLGEFTCVVHAGVHVREATAHSLEQVAATAAVDGYRDFVFDLTRVGRYETPALRSVADLWRRLAGLDCEVFVAARNPGVVDCLHRVIPAGVALSPASAQTSTHAAPARADASTASTMRAERAPSAKRGRPSGRAPPIAAYVSATNASKQPA